MKPNTAKWRGRDLVNANILSRQLDTERNAKLRASAKSKRDIKSAKPSNVQKPAPMWVIRRRGNEQTLLRVE